MLADDRRRRWSRQDAALPYDTFCGAIGGSHAQDDLDRLVVEEAAIAADHRNPRRRNRQRQREEEPEVGTLVYADRDYTFTQLPESLAGATHIRTHNDDKSATAPDFLGFETNLPATLYLAYDGRTTLRRTDLSPLNLYLVIKDLNSHSLNNRPHQQGHYLSLW